MKVLIDADGCPVVNITVDSCKKQAIPCLILCDTAHEIHREGAQTLVFDKGADSVDLALANRAAPGDLVVTQDYGLASLCLARGARVLHQDGWEYDQFNIQALLFERHAAREYRASGGRTKGPRKRTGAQNEAFKAALEQILSRDSRPEDPTQTP